MARRLSEVTGVFMDAGYRVSYFPTRGKGDARDYVNAYGAGFDMICCSGGDGTLNETVSGMIEAGLDIPIGYMPSGSTNDFAEFHNISSDVLTAARNIAEGSERRVDVGKLGGKYFINAADFGAFTWLPYTTPQRLKNKLASSSSLAGAMDFFGQKVVADDGLFEVLLLRRPTSPAELQSTIAALSSQELNNELITFCRTDKIELECMKKLNWALDGEKCVGELHHEVEMLPRRIRIVY